MAKKVAMRELWLVLGTRLLKSDDLHYGYWREGLEIKLSNLPQAQSAYSEYLMGKIPQGVTTILDVGCGTGHLSQLLLEKGYQVQGVSPSPALTDLVRERLGDDYKIHPTKFELVDTPERFDLVMFSESFQYIDPVLSLPKAHSLLNPGGHVLICDTFNKETGGLSRRGGGHNLEDFFRILSEQPFSILLDEDITEPTAPSITVLDEFRRDYAEPIRDAIGYYFRSNHPWVTKVVRTLFRKSLDKLAFSFSRMQSAEEFARVKSYRCLLLQSRG